MNSRTGPDEKIQTHYTYTYIGYARQTRVISGNQLRWYTTEEKVSKINISVAQDADMAAPRDYARWWKASKGYCDTSAGSERVSSMLDVASSNSLSTIN